MGGCYTCGEEGHMSRECPQNSRGGEDGKVREIYVPKESDDAVLFANSISTGINFAKYENIPVKVSGENVPTGIKDFETAGLSPLLLENIKKSGYTVPTPVQKRTLPIVMAGRDLMACAQTGSGKTAAFLLPVINKLISSRAGSNAGSAYAAPQCVVITPTRELAIQIKDESRKFAIGSVVKSVVTYGGVSIQYQLGELVKGCNILIATPGRLLDLVNRGKISFESVQFLILDEADRMLHMGFIPDIQRCVLNPKMPKKGDRQTLMFSATFPPEIQRSAKELLHNQLFVTVGVVGGACTDVAQNFYEVSKFEKREKLKDILTECNPKDKTLVFVKTKKNVDFLATYLSHQGLPTTSIHGDRLQREREQALFDFRNGKMSILVATDVAARGLDIKGVAHVVNFDMPDGVDDYVHRIGRTGRVGNVGKASSFYDSSEDRGVVGPLVKMLTDCKQKVPSWLAREAGGYRGGYGAGAGGASNLQEGTSSCGSITECTPKARVWLYQKNVFALQPDSSEYKHWAVVAEYMDEETGNLDRSELYEAGRHEGYVVASHKAFSENLSKKWMKEKGAEREILATNILNQDAAISFCSEVTNRREIYSWNKENCQKFVNEFIERFIAGKLSLPPNAEQSSLGKSRRLSDTSIPTSPRMRSWRRWSRRRSATTPRIPTVCTMARPIRPSSSERSPRLSLNMMKITSVTCLKSASNPALCEVGIDVVAAVGYDDAENPNSVYNGETDKAKRL